MLKTYFYSLLSRYIKPFIKDSDRVAFIGPTNPLLFTTMGCNHFKVFQINDLISGYQASSVLCEFKDWFPDVIIINGALHYCEDIQIFFNQIPNICKKQVKIFFLFYSHFWRPLLTLATVLGFRDKHGTESWIAPNDFKNFAYLSDLCITMWQTHVLLPIRIPYISELFNRLVARIPLFNLLNLVNLVVTRLPQKQFDTVLPSVSVVIPARNEAGNIEMIFKRLPRLGPDDEIIMIEGNSTDNTWDEIKRCAEVYSNNFDIKIGRQSGKGKADAVFMGFAMATKEILLILDADMTVPPEELPKFYRAIIENKGEFINGNRFVYPMKGKAMRFLNFLGNQFFAAAFSYVLGQPVKDTLCGTKVLYRKDWETMTKLQSVYQESDPFGDFFLLFGARSLGLHIVDVAIHYDERTYGSTNISRWRHGSYLFRALYYAAAHIKFL